jgi:hypothetical protein
MSDSDIPRFAELAADPEIAALLTFTPVIRKVVRPDGWSPELQRELIARIASTGTLQQAVWQMGKHATGAEGLYKKAGAAEFRAAWDAAIIIGRRRNGLDSAAPFAGPVPGITRRSKARDEGLERDINGRVREPGQRLNEHGEWEDEASFHRRAGEAKDSISMKLLNCRRLYLREICANPGKRAAFEILTELPIDWDRASRLEPQDDEPWKIPNMREPEWVVTAESGWSFGEFGYGPDRKAEARAAIDRLRAEAGEEAIDWGATE